MTLAAALVLILLQGAPIAQAPADDPGIRNFLQVNRDFCTGGQPRPEHFAVLKSRGVKAVLNLRTPGEHRAEEEKAAVEAAGMKYFNIPVVYRDPTFEQVEEFLRLTDDPANRPMFVHCTAAIRVGGFWLIRRVLRDGMTWDAALEEAKKVGLKDAPHLEEFAKSYLAARKGIGFPSPSSASYQSSWGDHALQRRQAVWVHCLLQPGQQP